jgi:putative transposase
MTNYRRYRLKGGCYFFTVALAEHRGRLLTENIQGLRTAFREVMAAHPFTMEAVVILPDHVHCIWTLPEGDDDFSTRWRQTKARVGWVERSETHQWTTHKACIKVTGQ